MNQDSDYHATVTAGACLALLLGVLGAWPANAQEEAMWGGNPGRNMVSSETGLPTRWDPATGEHIKWTAELGAQSYAGPILSGGKIFVGTNNEALRNPALTGDRGVMMAFQEADGKFLWQATHTKLPSGRVNDWPQQGVCSTPYILGDRLYYLSNRCEIICLDTEGFLDGENDGPFTEETDTSDIDADIIWKLDMMEELTVFPHNLATSSPVGADNLLFLVTGNGVDEGHVHIPSPFAPSFLAVDQTTGEVVWEDSSPGDNILHGQWSNPSYGVVNGQPQVIFPGGDGWLYALEPRTGKLIWKFDCNPENSEWQLGGRGSRNNILSTPVFHDNVVYIGVGQDPEHGEGGGNLWAIDATGSGDITKTGVVWHRGDDDFGRTISTAAISDGLLFLSDLSGYVYCLDASTGEEYWKHDTFAAIWGSPFVADGKVYIGDEDGDVTVFQAGKTLTVLHEVNMGSAVYTTPVAKDGVLYIVTRNKLFAITEQN